jgi:hypothetical protein
MLLTAWLTAAALLAPPPALAAAAAREGLRPHLLQLALAAQRRGIAAGAAVRDRLTVIDYSLASRRPRLWVLELASGGVHARELVAHGRGSGGDQAYRFSNRAGSLASSLGTFVTGHAYQGRHGLSLRLRGLDPGLNDMAAARNIVVHGAAYVSEATVRALGRLGRSQGCPALSPDAARRIIPLIRGGSVLFAYYPSPELEREPDLR